MVIRIPEKKYWGFGPVLLKNYVRKCLAIVTYASVDNPVIHNFIFTRPFSPVIYVKTSVVDNVDPWT
jgi:hypothetical protein